MPTPIVPVLLPLEGGTGVQVRQVMALSWGFCVNKLGSMSYTVFLDGIPLLDGPTSTRTIGLSLDNGLTVTQRMLSFGAQLDWREDGTSIGESGSCMGLALGATPVFRQEVQQVRFRDLLSGQKNYIRAQASPSDIVAPGDIIPSIAGLDAVPIYGSDPFAFATDNAVSNILVDADVNRDYVLKALDVFQQRLAGQVHPSHANYVIDSGDRGWEKAPAVSFGRVDTAPRLTLTNDLPHMVARGVTYRENVEDVTRSVDFDGGDSLHGMPESGKFTSIVTINHELADATGDYRSGMPVVGVYVNRNQGGVYFDPGDGALHPMSHIEMGVNCLWYDEPTHQIYAGTDQGTYAGAADPDVIAPWARLGSNWSVTTKVQKENGVLYAKGHFRDGPEQIVCFPNQSGQPDGQGIDGWSYLLSPPGFADFAVAGNCLYVLSSTYNRAILFYDLSNLGADTVFIGLPAGVVAQGLDVLQGPSGAALGVMVRCDTGARNLYYIAPGGRSLTYAGGGLVDVYGAPAMVNNVVVHPAGVFSYDTGDVPVRLLASTNRGMFVTASAGGNNWRRTGGQDNSQDIELKSAASAPPRTWLGRVVTRVYAITDRGLYASHDGLLHLVDQMAKPLGKGPAFYAVWKARLQRYPNNTDTTLLYPNPDTGPFTVSRMLNGLGQFVYVMFDPASVSAAGGHRFGHLPEYAAPALVPEVRSSQLLLDAESRFLAYAAGKRVDMTIPTFTDDAHDPKLDLRPGMMVACNFNLEDTYADIGNTPIVWKHVQGNFYVLENRCKLVEGGIVEITLRLSNLYLDHPRDDPESIVGDLFYDSSRRSLYSNNKK